jgi:EAL domain-containing protein (putative c-di-GMP-specific phosphodiesterase class I)
MQTLALLHDMGVRLAIDDFGTGYSSLAYLKRLPVDELKIDKSFVMNMERDLQDAKIVRSTIDLAHNLGLKVVSEGIESANTWKLLQSLACDVAQGYWVAKPMPLADFDDWLAHWERPEVGSWVMPTSWADWV